MNRRRIVLLGLVGFVLLVVITAPLWTPYFTTVEVNEDFPIAAADVPSPTIGMTDADMPSVTPDTAVEATSAEAAAPTPEAATPEAVALRSGTWIELDPVHGAEGSATIYQVGEERIVRLENFRVTNGPDLYVVLAKNIPTAILDGVGEDWVNLGTLKGNVGSQNYTIPAEVNLDEYSSVVIYCLQFNVVFSSAALS